MAKVYIAGKITGTEQKECMAKFEAAEKLISAMGYEVVNPLKLGITWNTPSDEAVKKCLPYLQQCTFLFMMESWRTSEGSMVEYLRFTKEYSDIYHVVFEEDNGLATLANYSKLLNQTADAVNC